MKTSQHDTSSSCLILVGEKSGEEHCMTFLPALKLLCPDVHFFGVGGDEMKQADVELIYHLRDFSSWGITEVATRIPFYYRAMKLVLQEVEQRKCQTAILIDFQTFNLKLATKLKKKGVKVLYYVAPQAWAWKEWRGKVLAQTVHTLFTILPFEKRWFENKGVPRVRAVPHPLLLRFQNQLNDVNQEIEKNKSKRPRRLLLLPGSRDFEVEHLLPLFLNAVDAVKEKISLEVILVKASSVNPRLYKYYESRFDSSCDDTDLAWSLKWADLCLAASGTVTLATALFNIPTIVCYKASLFTAFIYENFISYKGFISLPNIIHETCLFPELIQDFATSYNIEKNLLKLLTDQNHFEKIKNLLKDTKKKLSGDPFSLPEYLAKVINE